MKKIFFGIAKIILSAIIIPLWFIEFFVGIGYLPDRNGNVHKAVFTHNMFENISDLTNPAIAYIAVALSAMLALASVIANVVAIKVSDNKKLRLISDIIFIVDVAFFLVLLLFASTIARGYWYILAPSDCVLASSNAITCG